jgi:hypothetical protein
MVITRTSLEIKKIGEDSFGVVFIVSDNNGDNYAIKTVNH